MRIVLIFLFIVSCTTRTTLTLNSSPPKVKIFYKKMNGGFELIGETPFSADVKKIHEEYNTHGPVFLQFRKKGYEKFNTYFTELNSVDVDFSFDMTPRKGIESYQQMDALIGELFRGQRLIRGGRFREALEKLDQLEIETPFLSIIPELKGSVFYLQKQYPQALDAFRSAYESNNENSEALRMMNLLEQSVKKRGKK